MWSSRSRRRGRKNVIKGQAGTRRDTQGDVHEQVGPTVSPGRSSEIRETVEPRRGLEQLHETVVSREKTRRRIAYLLVFILAGMVAVGCVGWLSHGEDVERMQNFGLIFAPVTTLLASMLAFYFSSKE